MLLQQHLCLLQCCSDRRRYKLLASHNLVNFYGVIMYETQITVCQNTDQLLVLIHNRHTGDAIFAH
ncbi:hypothetical protein D3C77_763200 [compost metagenome]